MKVYVYFRLNKTLEEVVGDCEKNTSLERIGSNTDSMLDTFPSNILLHYFYVVHVKCAV